VPRYDQRVQESDATVRSDVEHVRVKEFEDRDAHLLITSTALSSDDPEQVFTFQFLSDRCLDYIQDLLRDQAFKLAKRFFLENRAYWASFLPFTFTEKKLSNLFEQRHRRTLYFLAELPPPLDIGQAGEFARRQLQKASKLVVDVGPFRSWRQLLPAQLLGNIRLADFRSVG